MKFLPHVRLPQVSSEEQGLHANKANDTHTIGQMLLTGSAGSRGSGQQGGAFPGPWSVCEEHTAGAHPVTAEERS